MKLLETAATEIACEEYQRVNGELNDDVISKEFCLNVMENLEQKAPGFSINQYVKAISKAISKKTNNQIVYIYRPR